MVKFQAKNGAKAAPRARRTPRKNIQKRNQTVSVRSRATRSRRVVRTNGAITAAVRTNASLLNRLGFSDIRSHRMAWIMGYTFVGDGTNGVADAVLFKSAGGTYLAGNAGNGNYGNWPILGADTQLGASYVTDIEKHYARKTIKRMWVHVVSLQPSTANNMMAVVSVSRGPGLGEQASSYVVATATLAQQTFTNVMAMNKALPVDSFESKTMEITEFIAGGSGPRQNEFELEGSQLANATTVLVSAGPVNTDLIGVSPASLVVSGNSTTSGLRNTNVHAIIIEQEVDLIDFIGGSVDKNPVGVASQPTASVDDDECEDTEFYDLLSRARACRERKRAAAQDKIGLLGAGASKGDGPKVALARPVGTIRPPIHVDVFPSTVTRR